jgi:hypothetical protein
MISFLVVEIVGLKGGYYQSERNANAGPLPLKPDKHLVIRVLCLGA